MLVAPARRPEAGADTTREAAVKEILDAILDPSSQPGDFAALPLPESYRAVTLHRDEEHMFDGIHTRDKDPRKSLHVQEVPIPELGPGEAIVAVMASAINYNTVWTSIFEPVSTFASSAGTASCPSSPRSTTSPTTWSARTWPASCCASAPV